MKKIHSREDRAVDFTASLIGALFLVLTAVPFLHVVSKAFSSETALVSNSVTIFPKGFQLTTIRYVLSSSLFSRSFVNSIIVTLSGTFISLIVTAMAGYPLSKRQLPLSRPLTVVFVFTMWFSGGMVPTYLLMTELGITNSLLSLILPASISVYNLLLVKSYYEGLPSALEESACIDGASQIRTLFSIVMPLSFPVFATITLFLAVSLWNDYFHAMMYITNTKLKTLPVYLRDIIAESQSDTTVMLDEDANILPEGVRAATIVASTVPILLVYPFLQKYLMKGVTLGAVKG